MEAAEQLQTVLNRNADSGVSDLKERNKPYQLEITRLWKNGEAKMQNGEAKSARRRESYSCALARRMFQLWLSFGTENGDIRMKVTYSEFRTVTP